MNAHVHMSVSYIFVCDKNESIRPLLSENSAVSWFDINYFVEDNFNAQDVYRTIS